MRSKQQRITLPKLKTEFTDLPKIAPHQIRAAHLEQFRRYNTESLSPEDKVHVSSTISQKKPRHMKFSLTKQKKFVRERNSEIINLLESNRDSSFQRSEAISKIIDTRKSIKLLVDFFHSKSQQSKALNEHCYHSPKKRPLNLIEIRQSVQDYHPIRKSFIGAKKIKHKIVQMEEDNEPVFNTKSRKANFTASIKIQNIFLNHLKIQEGPKHKNVIYSPPSTSQTPSVIQIGKVRQKKMKKNIGSEKITHFGAWNINPQDTQYLP